VAAKLLRSRLKVFVALFLTELEKLEREINAMKKKATVQ
jgi:hypothetical protein